MKAPDCCMEPMGLISTVKERGGVSYIFQCRKCGEVLSLLVVKKKIKKPKGKKK